MPKINKWWCGHSETTEEDGEGYAVCLNCGSTIVVRLTAKIFDQQVEAMKKDGLW
jgi:hypothetical protein